jgi:prolyl oligopeptidase
MARTSLPFVLLASLTLGQSFAPSRPEKAARKLVTESYHGVEVRDEYRWLEDAASPATRQWVKDQNRFTRAVLDDIPARETIRKQLQALAKAQSPRYERLQFISGRVFAIRDDNLIVIPSADEVDDARELVDPDEVLPDKDATIDLFEPSLDGKRVAVAMSIEGREEGTLRVYDTETGKETGDLIPRVTSSSGGSVAWKGDGSGFYYTRHLDPAATKGCRQLLYFHKLGAKTETDECVFGKELPRLVTLSVDNSQDGRHIVVAVQHGTDDDMALHLLGAAGGWKQIADYKDRITGTRFGPNDTLWLLSHKDAPRGKVLRLSLKTPELARAETVVPQSEGVIRDFAVTPTRLCVLDRLNGSARCRNFDWSGKESKPLPLKSMSSVSQILALDGDTVLVQNESYLEPPVWLQWNLATGSISKTTLSSGEDTDFSDCEVVREFAVSKDGTKVPLTILRRKNDKLDGERPALLSGYGGYGESELPRYEASRRIWLDQGGIYAFAHVRGDGDFGDDWHNSGKLLKKQNVFDDFAACARYLIERKYTRAEKVAIEGGSNGGLLMGAALTQHPELFRAVVSHVGLYDMLRFQRHPNGMYSVTEFGDLDVAEQFRAMYAYSPYHRVKDGTAYPAILFTVGANDNRVPPSETWKMAARLQAATASDRPVLLSTTFKGGHDTPASEQLMLTTDMFAFLFQELGVKYRAKP